MNDSLAGCSPDVVGRDAECARVDSFVEALPWGARALLIRGEPGIGKTTLWRHAIGRCRTAGHRVLVTRTAEEEMSLAHVGLADLFEEIDTDPALLRDDDAMARGRAVLTALRGLADTGPVVLAIDDAQWLDSASARAVRYALRRFETEPVGVLATTRVGADAGDPLAASTAFAPTGYELLELGPLTLGALRRARRDGSEHLTAVAPPDLRRVGRQSALRDRAGPRPRNGRPGLGSDRRSPASRLRPGCHCPQARDRAARAPGRSRGRIGSRPDVGGRAGQHRGGGAARGAAAGRRAAPVARRRRVVGGALRSPARRLGRLRADELACPPRSARAPGRAVQRPRRPGPSSRALDGRVGRRRCRTPRSRRRACPSAGRVRCRRRLRRACSPADSEVRPAHGATACARRDRASRGRRRSREGARARRRADRLASPRPRAGGSPDPAVLRRRRDLELAESLLVRALADADADEQLRGRVLDLLGWLRGMFRGDLRQGIECASEAVEIADRVGDAGFSMLAAGHLGHMSALVGEPRPDLMARAVELAVEVGAPRLGGGPHAWLAKQVFWAGDLDGARAQFEAALATDRRSGNELERPYRLYDLALVECAAGNLASAAEIVDQGLEAAGDAENADAAGWLLFPLAMIQAWRGLSEAARASAGLLLTQVRRARLQWIVRGKSVLGLLALSEGDAPGAAEELVDAVRMLEQMGFAHPGALPILPDAIEALAGTGDTELAEAFRERLERQSAALDSAWAQAALARSHGTLLVARGDPEAAVALLEEGVSTFDRLGYRPAAARAVLALGRAQARSGHRTLAADTLADARIRFAEIGAAHWEARTVEELERAAPGRVAGVLTPAEARIAALVARGLKNREIGTALYMSVATVEAHLTRIYRKLAIRSRTELARLVADGSLPLGDDG